MTKLTLTEFGAQNAEGGRELGQIRNERERAVDSPGPGEITPGTGWVEVPQPSPCPH